MLCIVFSNFNFWRHHELLVWSGHLPVIAGRFGSEIWRVRKWTCGHLYKTMA